MSKEIKSKKRKARKVREVREEREEREKATIKERAENFFYSDTPSATATKFLLMFLATGFFAFGGAIIPGILKAMKGFESSGAIRGDEYTKKQINNALGSLKRQKLIKIVKLKNGRFKIKLTNKGKKRILKLSIEDVYIKKPKVWDGKWRIVIFDVPNEFNKARWALRKKIKDMGFKQLQKSVWVHPYDCEDEIIFVAEVFDVEKYVEIIVAEKVLHEKVLKKAFKV